MHPLLAAATGLLLAGSAMAQVSAEDREFLLGTEADLTERILARLTTKKLESLTAQTPDWLQILIRRTFEKSPLPGY